MRPRYFLSFSDDTLNGIYNHRSGELVGRKPLEGRLVQLPRAEQIKIGRRSASVRLGKMFLAKLKGLGIK